MNDRRAILIVIVACAAIAAAGLPPAGEWRGWTTFNRSEWRQTRAHRMARQVRTLAERRLLLERVPELRSRAASLGAGEIRVEMPAGTPAEIARRLTSVVERQRAQLGGASEVPVLVSLFREVRSRDSLPMSAIGRRPRMQYFTSDVARGGACYAIVRVDTGTPPEFVSGRWSEQSGVLGPCAFFAAFGQPGPHIRSWLQSRQFDIAHGTAFGATAAARATAMDADGDINYAKLYTNLDASPSRACQAGAVDSCRDLVMGRGLAGRSNAPGLERLERSLGVSEAYFLSDLVVEFGRDRFRKFWTSTAEPSRAFEQAFGTSIGQWTHRWMRYRYGPETRGPGVPLKSATFALLATLGLLAACIAVERRQVG